MKSAMLERLGLPGVAGIGVLLFCLSFYLGNVVPARSELAQLAAARTELAAAAARSAAARRDEAAAPGGALVLPPLSAAPALLLQLDALAAKHGLSIAHTAYQIKAKGGSRRLEVSMPLKAAYPPLRAYLRDVLALADATLDELSLQRAQAGDPLVDAQVRLSFGFAATP